MKFFLDTANVDEIREAEAVMFQSEVPIIPIYYYVTSSLVQPYVKGWYADLETPIALVGEKRLTRDQMIRVNPGVVNAAYEVQWEVVFNEVSSWVEGAR